MYYHVVNESLFESDAYEAESWAEAIDFILEDMFPGEDLPYFSPEMGEDDLCRMVFFNHNGEEKHFTLYQFKGNWEKVNHPSLQECYAISWKLKGWDSYADLEIKIIVWKAGEAWNTGTSISETSFSDYKRRLYQRLGLHCQKLGSYFEWHYIRGETRFDVQAEVERLCSPVYNDRYPEIRYTPENSIFSNRLKHRFLGGCSDR